MKQSTKQKIWVLVIVTIFLGSYAGVITWGVGMPAQGEEIPTQKILTNLTEAQRAGIISKGWAVIDFLKPTNCSDACQEATNQLESYTTTYSPYVFLVESESIGSSVNVTINVQTYSSEKQFDSFNATEIEDFICTNLPLKPRACSFREI